MTSSRNLKLPSLLLAVSLVGCASQPSQPVIAPCPAIPPLPEPIAAPAEFPTALSKLNETLTKHGEPPLVIQPASPPARSPMTESAEPVEIDGLPVVSPDLRDPADEVRRREAMNALRASNAEEGS